MRQILLAGKYYKLAPGSDIIKRAINPWKAKVMSTAGREYSDFGQAELEEYHDFRNGIGLESALPAESARLWWSEGIDFSTARSAVLGPLVNTLTYDGWVKETGYSLLDFIIPTTATGYCYECTTADTSGATEPTWGTVLGGETADGDVRWTCRAFLAPIKIIDFDDATYIIQNSRIAKVVSGLMVVKSNDFPDPIDALVVIDSTDEYLIVSSATGAIYTTDGDTWTNLAFAFIEEDANSKLTLSFISGGLKATGADVDRDEDVYLYIDCGANYFDALNKDFEIYIASTGTIDSRSGMAISNTIGSVPAFAATDISVIGTNADDTIGRIRLYRGFDVDDDYYDGSLDTLYYCTLVRAAGNDSVSVKIYSDSARETLVDTITVAGFSTTTYRYFYGFVNWKSTHSGYDWDGYVQTYELLMGYLADYDNRLYSISTDGKLVSYSAAKDIDVYSGYFRLTGNYGTVYDLFEGKLLADGTPTLYFCGTQGLFTIDTTTKIAYKQEVAYPPLTYAGHRGLYWNANVWVATGYGILKVAPAMATEIGPNLDDGLPDGYQGYIYNMVTVNNWLVFCVNGGLTDRSSILKRNSSLGGNLQVYTTTQSHKARDLANRATSANASDQDTLETLLNEIKDDYNTHRASTTYHATADSTNVVEEDDASDLTTAIALATEIKADYNAHCILSGVHINNDTTNEVTSATPTTLATCITLANEIKADYNAHTLSGGLQIACLHHSPSSQTGCTNGRLWFGEGTDVKYMMFPDTTSNVKQISTYQYVDDSGYGKFPILRKLAAISKTALGVAAITKSCDTDDYIEVFYGLNGAAPTTSLGTFKDSPRATILTFDSGLGTAFYTIQFAIKLFRNGGNTTSPELESLMFYYLPTPTVINGWLFHILATEDDADAIISEFEDIRDTKTLVAFYPSGDELKTSYNVKLTTMPLRFYCEEQGGREGYIEVDVQEVFKG